MRRLSVFIEMNGENVYVGEIAGKDSTDACFTYADTYLENQERRAISIGLPLEEKSFLQLGSESFLRGCFRKDLQELASEGATESAELVTKSHLSLTGASGKVGLYYDGKEKKWYLPIGEAPSTHIVKQSHVRLKKIVANEHLCLLTAKYLGIEIPESFIVTTDGEEETVLFATKRYDRKFIKEDKKLNNMPVPRRLHQEDFAQALGIAAANKYEKNNEGYLCF